MGRSGTSREAKTTTMDAFAARTASGLRSIPWIPLRAAVADGFSPLSWALTIEFRIIYLQREQLRLLPEGHHQSGSAAHPLERATSMQAQLGEGARAEVG